MKAQTSLGRPDRTQQSGYAMHRRRHTDGSALVTGLVTITVLSMISAAAFQTVTSRFRSNYQTASWHDALTSAEDGMAYAFTRLRSPLTRPMSTTFTNLSTSSTSLSGLALTDPLKVPGSIQSDLASLQPGATSTNGTMIAGICDGATFSRLQMTKIMLPHVGQGSSEFTAVATIDVLPGTNSVNAWYRIQSAGVVPLPGSANVGMQKYDNLLRKLQFHWDTAGNTITRPQAIRTIEVIAKPVTTGSAAIFAQTGINMNNQNILVDSYDSRSTTTSTNGAYDPAKATKQAYVVTNDMPQPNSSPGVINLSPTGAKIYGSIATNDTAVQGNTTNVSGTITQDFYQPLPNPPDPQVVSSTWSNFALSSFENKSTPTMNTGTATAPTRYKIYDTGNKNSTDLSLSGSDDLTFDTTGGGYVEIWVPGALSLTGQAAITIPSGVHATFYVDGNVSIGGQGIENTSLIPGNLTLYGNHDPTVSQTMTVAGNGVFAGVIYAPSAAVQAKGSGNNGDIYGSIVANTIFFNGTTSLHYDTALGDLGAVIDYRIISWYEDNTLTR